MGKVTFIAFHNIAISGGKSKQAEKGVCLNEKNNDMRHATRYSWLNKYFLKDTSVLPRKPR